MSEEIIYKQLKQGIPGPNAYNIKDFLGNLKKHK